MFISYIDSNTFYFKVVLNYKIVIKYERPRKRLPKIKYFYFKKIVLRKSIKKHFFFYYAYYVPKLNCTNFHLFSELF